MNSQRFCPTLDLETGEQRATNQAPRRFKFTGGKNNDAGDTKVTTNGDKLQTQKAKPTILSDDDLGISTSSFKPRFPVAGTETKMSSSTSSSNPSSTSFGSVKLSEVDGLPTTRLGRNGKFLGNYSHNFRNDEARNKKDWWKPK